MLRYYYSDEKVFSFNPIQDRTIKVKRTKVYFVFEFQNLIKNDNLSPKIHFLNINERMLRYYYSDEKDFSFNPIQDIN